MCQFRVQPGDRILFARVTGQRRSCSSPGRTPSRPASPPRTRSRTPRPAAPSPGPGSPASSPAPTEGRRRRSTRTGSRTLKATRAKRPLGRRQHLRPRRRRRRPAARGTGPAAGGPPPSRAPVVGGSRGIGRPARASPRARAPRAAEGHVDIGTAGAGRGSAALRRVAGGRCRLLSVRAEKCASLGRASRRLLLHDRRPGGLVLPAARAARPGPLRPARDGRRPGGPRHDAYVLVPRGGSGMRRVDGARAGHARRGERGRARAAAPPARVDVMVVGRTSVLRRRPDGVAPRAAHGEGRRAAVARSAPTRRCRRWRGAAAELSACATTRVRARARLFVERIGPERVTRARRLGLQGRPPRQRRAADAAGPFGPGALRRPARAVVLVPHGAARLPAHARGDRERARVRAGRAVSVTVRGYDDRAGACAIAGATRALRRGRAAATGADGARCDDCARRAGRQRAVAEARGLVASFPRRSWSGEAHPPARRRPRRAPRAAAAWGAGEGGRRRRRVTVTRDFGGAHGGLGTASTRRRAARR